MKFRGGGILLRGEHLLEVSLLFGRAAKNERDALQEMLRCKRAEILGTADTWRQGARKRGALILAEGVGARAAEKDGSPGQTTRERKGTPVAETFGRAS